LENRKYRRIFALSNKHKVLTNKMPTQRPKQPFGI